MELPFLKKSKEEAMEVDTTLRLSTTRSNHLHPLPFLHIHVETSQIMAPLSFARFAQEVHPSFLSLCPPTQQILCPSFRPDHGFTCMPIFHLPSPSQASHDVAETRNETKSLGKRKRTDLGFIGSSEDYEPNHLGVSGTSEDYDYLGVSGLSEDYDYLGVSGSSEDYEPDHLAVIGSSEDYGPDHLGVIGSSEDYELEHLGVIGSSEDYEPDRKRRKPARIKGGYEEPYAQLPPALADEKGPGWGFLYRKRLEVSDVRVDQNRLFVRAVGTEKIVEGFMREEERMAVGDQKGPGIEFEGVDGNGRKYKLRMKKWGSLGVTAVKTEWSKMVKANQAKAGHWVDVWGRRPEEGGFSLAFIFSDGGEDGGGGKGKKAA